MAGDKPLTTHDLMADRKDAEGGSRHVREDAHQALLADERLDDFRHRWDRVQTGFVDDPRRAVEEADELVAEVMRELADIFSREREGLERQWDQDEAVDTEVLRTALQRYRAFFNRLLSTEG